MSHNVVAFYTDAGEITYYRPLSARLADFLAQYGPQQGYALITDLQDSLSLKPGLLRLYEIAIQAGRKPEDLGLPPLALAGQTHVCRATLVDESGRVVASSTAAKHIQAYKDLEVLETAARQRLLAALGFGGEVFDGDEGQDQSDQGLTRLGASPGLPPASVTLPPDTPSASAAAADSPARQAAAIRVAASPSTSDPAGEAALAMLQRQIHHLASLQGLDAPVVTTRAEAQAALKQLLQARAS